MRTLTAVSALAATAATTAGLAVYGNRRLQHRLSSARRQLASARDELTQARSAALRDPLTGLANRAAIDAELARRLRSDSPFVLFLIDLDGFKPVNDVHGHLVGDLVLAEVARRLLDGPAIGDDLVGRLGGDEFILIADSDLTFATGCTAPNICDAVSRPIAAGAATVRVSASVGLLRVLPGDDPADCLASVDAAMYRAKAAGGGRWVDFGSHKVPLLMAAGTRPVLRLRGAHPHRVPAESGVVVAR